jgi:hypothetical protein
MWIAVGAHELAYAGIHLHVNHARGRTQSVDTTVAGVQLDAEHSGTRGPDGPNSGLQPGAAEYAPEAWTIYGILGHPACSGCRRAG